MSGFIGCGQLLFNRKVDGVYTGWSAFGNATKFEITESAEVKERRSKSCATYGQTLDAASIKGSTAISVMLDDFDNALAMTLLGDSTANTVTGASVTSEVHVANIGKSVMLNNIKTSAIAVKDTGGATTYVLDTDYAITNAAIGQVTILAGGSIVEGQGLEIDYTYGSYVSESITGGTQSSIDTKLKLVGQNLADQGKDVIVTVHQAILNPASGVDFLSEEFVELQIDGVLVTDSTEGNAYTVELDIV